ATRPWPTRGSSTISPRIPCGSSGAFPRSVRTAWSRSRKAPGSGSTSIPWRSSPTSCAAARSAETDGAEGGDKALVALRRDEQRASCPEPDQHDPVGARDVEPEQSLRRVEPAEAAPEAASADPHPPAELAAERLAGEELGPGDLASGNGP